MIHTFQVENTKSAITAKVSHSLTLAKNGNKKTLFLAVKITHITISDRRYRLDPSPI